MSLIILSGGLDSTVALYKFRPKLAVSFNYGSKHNDIEISHAAISCEKLGIEHLVVNMRFLGSILKSDLLKSGGDIPEGHYAEPIMKRTVVPFRNGIMLSIACGIAESSGLTEVIIGNHSGDHAVYPDCRDGFINAMENAMLKGTYAGIRLKSPFLNLTKTEITKLGIEIGVPFEDSYSCYNGEATHCGRCSTCFERREAFYLTGFPDPTTYIDKTPIGELIHEYTLLHASSRTDGAVKEDSSSDIT